MRARRVIVAPQTQVSPKPSQPDDQRTQKEIAMAHRIVEEIEKPYLKQNPPKFDIGDTVDVATRIVEGDKERVQTFSGTVIARKGRGINETFIVRRIEIGRASCRKE